MKFKYISASKSKRNTFKNILSISLVLILMISSLTLNASEVHQDFLKEADILKELGLFKGSDIGYELNRYGTRIEAAVIIVRLLGAEVSAKNLNYEHPFTDVPTWADPYVGFLHHEGLTKGINDDEYGSIMKLSPNQFLTFALRSLAYDDAIGDFKWDEALDKSLELDIIDEEFKEYLSNDANIYRDDMVAILYNILNQEMKDKDTSLIDFLITKRVTTLEKAMDLGVYNQPINISFSGQIKSINDLEKAVITDTINGYNYYVIVPFGNKEDVYISVVEVEVGDVIYQCIIPKEVFYTTEELQHLFVGQNITITGQYATNVLDKTSYNRYIIIK